MGLTGYAATSVTDYQPTLYTIPEEDLCKTVVWQQMFTQMEIFTLVVLTQIYEQNKSEIMDML